MFVYTLSIFSTVLLFNDHISFSVMLMCPLGLLLLQGYQEKNKFIAAQGEAGSCSQAETNCAVVR